MFPRGPKNARSEGKIALSTELRSNGQDIPPRVLRRKRRKKKHVSLGGWVSEP
jgi:hypothetical protein